MKKILLDKDENTLEKEIEKGEWVEVSNMTAEMAKYQALACASLNKNKKINIRLSDWDFTNIKIRAFQEGLPYQTLVSSIIHKYLTGMLKTS